MRWRILIAVGIALTMLPSTALASHMGNYRNEPVNHDLQGTILEPDGLSTSVLGPLTTNCVLDLPPFEGRCVADPVPKPSGALGSVLAPGCTGAGNVRRVAGQCGLWTVGTQGQGPGIVPPPVSEQGMPGNAAPGAYTPTKADSVRFLDGQWTWMTPQAAAGPANAIDLNQALRETERLSGMDTVVADNILPYLNFFWVWYGQWTDLNGNGVVDHGTPGTMGPTANEYQWLGSCLTFNGDRDPGVIQKGLCIEDGNPNIDPPGAPCADAQSTVGCAGTTISIWFYPGNHNGWSPILGPDDYPGSQQTTWVLFGADCSHEPGEPNPCDEIAKDFGDPVFDRQDELNRDLEDFDDRTADPSDTGRQWAGIRGWATPSYGDDGLLITAVQVYGVNCRAAPEEPTGELPDTCTFADVDRQTSIAPGVQELLVGPPEEYPNGGLKQSARAGWVIVRDSGLAPDTSTLERKVSSVVNSRDVYLARQGPLQGTVDDLTTGFGVSREPNTPGDLYVGVRYRACSELPVGDARNPTAGTDLAEFEAQHRGYCNIDADGRPAYSAYRDGPRGYIDLQPVKSLGFLRPVTLVPGLPCQLCIFGSLGSIGLYAEPNEFPPVAETHGRSLGPGQYVFGTGYIKWHDLPTEVDESLFPDPPDTTIETYPADGWRGSIVASTGMYRYRGYADHECTTELDGPLGASVHTAAECNPYLDGNIENPQGGNADEIDGDGTCANAGVSMTLAPVDGSMDTQILVWREHGQGLEPDPLDLNGDGEAELLPPIEAYGPGGVLPLFLGMECGGGGAGLNDFLIWAEGNRGDDIVTRITGNVQLNYDLNGDGLPDFDTVTDVDLYPGWGL